MYNINLLIAELLIKCEHQALEKKEWEQLIQLLDQMVAAEAHGEIKQEWINVKKEILQDGDLEKDYSSKAYEKQKSDIRNVFISLMGGSSHAQAWERLKDAATGEARRKRMRQTLAVAVAGAVLIAIVFNYTMWPTLFGERKRMPNTFTQADKEEIKSPVLQINGMQFPLRENVDTSFDQVGLRSTEAIEFTIQTPIATTQYFRLPDGSKVWLNAASHLSYTQFASGRDLSLQGEAYFEVQKDANRPFVVRAGNGVSVGALGTSFNVNAYTENPQFKTLLVSGSVNVNYSGTNTVLVPGQMASLKLADSAHRIHISTADVNSVLAWKDNKFIFNSKTIAEVMNEIGHYYGYTISYAKGVNPNRTLTGACNRSGSLDQVLDKLESAGVAQFKVANDTLHLIPF